MAQVYHIPKIIMQRRGWLHMQNDSSAVVREVADLVSVRRFGVISALLSVEQREVLLEAVQELWEELDELGRAS